MQPPALRPLQAFAVYTGARVAVFVLSLGVLYGIGFRSFALVIGALVLSGVASLLLLRRQRAAVSTAIAARPRRDALSRPVARRGGATAADPDPEGAADRYADPYDDADDAAGDDADPYADDPAVRTPGRPRPGASSRP